jgi:putative CocE/NonD family hydrolase
MGPWGHGGYRNGGRIGDLVFADSRMPRGYSAAEFLAWRLLGEKTAAVGRPAVAYYVMGDVEDPEAPGREWRFAEGWPVPATETSYHLRSDGRLTRAPPEKDTAYAGYAFDPANPCPTTGGCNLVLAKGPKDQRKVEARDDVLTFTTAPLEAPVEVTGHPVAKLFVTSSAKDTDLSVRFTDVYPDGRSLLMAEGMLRLRFREGFTKPVPLVPGEVYEVSVPLWPTSVAVNRGHRIRVAITSSNHPRFDVNPGTGRPGKKGGKTVRQINRIWCDAERPSCIVLPVVERD